MGDENHLYDLMMKIPKKASVMTLTTLKKVPKRALTMISVILMMASKRPTKKRECPRNL
jgi:hypothetical protein